jgi:hypothetical protein
MEGTTMDSNEDRKTSTLHQAFSDLYQQRWQQRGGTLLAFSERCGVRRETLRGWQAKDRIELLEHIEAALAALGARIRIEVDPRDPEVPQDRRRSTLG